VAVDSIDFFGRNSTDSISTVGRKDARCHVPCQKRRYRMSGGEGGTSERNMYPVLVLEKLWVCVCFSGRETACGVPLPDLCTIVFAFIRVIMNEYHKTKRYFHRPTNLTSYTCLSLSTDPGFGEGLSTVSRRISEGPSSTLPLPDLDRHRMRLGRQGVATLASSVPASRCRVEVPLRIAPCVVVSVRRPFAARTGDAIRVLNIISV